MSDTAVTDEPKTTPDQDADTQGAEATEATEPDPDAA